MQKLFAYEPKNTGSSTLKNHVSSYKITLESPTHTIENILIKNNNHCFVSGRVGFKLCRIWSGRVRSGLCSIFSDRVGVGSDSGSNLSVGSGAGTKSSIRAGVYLKDILKLVCVYNLIYCDCYILSECSKSISCPFA
jgi:hypothetical protein